MVDGDRGRRNGSGGRSDGQRVGNAAQRALRSGELLAQDAAYPAFADRFPYQETDDQLNAISDVVADLEAAARFPHVTSALADLRGITLSYDAEKRNAQSSGINADVVALAQRFGMLMAEYNQAIGDGKISVNEAKRLLRETLALQQVLLEMKLNLEEEAS